MWPVVVVLQTVAALQHAPMPRLHLTPHPILPRVQTQPVAVAPSGIDALPLAERKPSAGNNALSLKGRLVGGQDALRLEPSATCSCLLPHPACSNAAAAFKTPARYYHARRSNDSGWHICSIARWPSCLDVCHRGHWRCRRRHRNGRHQDKHRRRTGYASRRLVLPRRVHSLCPASVCHTASIPGPDALLLRASC